MDPITEGAIVVLVAVGVAAWWGDRQMAKAGKERDHAAQLAKSAEELAQKAGDILRLENRISQMQRELAAMADDNEILRAQVNFSREPA